VRRGIIFTRVKIGGVSANKMPEENKYVLFEKKFDEIIFLLTFALLILKIIKI
jgi:hypothetical protein